MSARTAYRLHPAFGLREADVDTDGDADAAAEALQPGELGFAWLSLSPTAQNERRRQTCAALLSHVAERGHAVVRVRAPAGAAPSPAVPLSAETVPQLVEGAADFDVTADDERRVASADRGRDVTAYLSSAEAAELEQRLAGIRSGWPDQPGPRRVGAAALMTAHFLRFVVTIVTAILASRLLDEVMPWLLTVPIALVCAWFVLSGWIRMVGAATRRHEHA